MLLFLKLIKFKGFSFGSGGGKLNNLAKAIVNKLRELIPYIKMELNELKEKLRKYKNQR